MLNGMKKRNCMFYVNCILKNPRFFWRDDISLHLSKTQSLRSFHTSLSCENLQFS